MKVSVLLVSYTAAALWGLACAAPFYGSLTATNGNLRETFHIPKHSAFTGSLGETIITNPEYYSRNNPSQRSLNVQSNMADNNQEVNEGEPLVRRRRLADDKKLDLKMKLQRVKKVVSLDAIGSYSIFRNKDRTTSLKAFGSTELWYDGHEFGIKKPGLGLQFTIYYDTNNRL